MASKPPAYQHYAQDWLAGTAHLTLEEQGAFQRLLDHQWIDGPLPDNQKALSRMLGVSQGKFRRIWADLQKHFPLTDAGRANERLEEERQKQLAYRQAQAERAARPKLVRGVG